MFCLESTVSSEFLSTPGHLTWRMDGLVCLLCSRVGIIPLAVPLNFILRVGEIPTSKLGLREGEISLLWSQNRMCLRVGKILSTELSPHKLPSGEIPSIESWFSGPWEGKILTEESGPEWEKSHQQSWAHKRSQGQNPINGVVIFVTLRRENSYSRIEPPSWENPISGVWRLLGLWVGKIPQRGDDAHTNMQWCNILKHNVRCINNKGDKSNCIYTTSTPMRLVRREDNPNKKNPLKYTLCPT